MSVNKTTLQTLQGKTTKATLYTYTSPSGNPIYGVLLDGHEVGTYEGVILENAINWFHKEYGRA